MKLCAFIKIEPFFLNAAWFFSLLLFTIIVCILCFGIILPHRILLFFWYLISRRPFLSAFLLIYALRWRCMQTAIELIVSSSCARSVFLHFNMFSYQISYSHSHANFKWISSSFRFSIWRSLLCEVNQLHENENTHKQQSLLSLFNAPMFQ